MWWLDQNQNGSSASNMQPEKKQQGPVRPVVRGEKMADERSHPAWMKPGSSGGSLSKGVPSVNGKCSASCRVGSPPPSHGEARPSPIVSHGGAGMMRQIPAGSRFIGETRWRPHQGPERPARLPRGDDGLHPGGATRARSQPPPRDDVMPSALDADIFAALDRRRIL